MGVLSRVALCALLFVAFLTLPLEVRVAPQSLGHPCHGPSASYDDVPVGQPFLLGWCHSEYPTKPTGWILRRNGHAMDVEILRGGPGVTGEVVYHVLTVEDHPGRYVYEVAALNGTIESAALVLPTVHVVARGAPARPTKGRVSKAN
jgi:hypothetical protein